MELDVQFTESEQNIDADFGEYQEVSGGGNADLTGYVKKTDYATAATHGVVRAAAGDGIGVNNGALYVACCSNAEIDAKKSYSRPIVPANLEYAVKSVGDGYYATEEQVGDIDTALDVILAIQEELKPKGTLLG